jgi:hypothetical protein
MVEGSVRRGAEGAAECWTVQEVLVPAAPASF